MLQFSVSEARTAIACPRVFYFDEQRFRQSKAQVKTITRLWSGAANSITACGQMFHTTIDRFNRQAGKSTAVLAALIAVATQSADAGNTALAKAFTTLITKSCLDRARLATKNPEQQRAFIAAVHQYVGELTDLASYAVRQGRPPQQLVEELFGDSRKNVDVTFYVGQQNQPIRVRGIIDYLYYDYRLAAHRIIDFKLTSSTASARDQTQTALYALMHHQQHGTQAATAVMYLHPQREMAEHTWEGVFQRRHVIYNLLASMQQWAEYDETTKVGLLPPGEQSLCHGCPWNRNNLCEQRLGSKTEGHRSPQWQNELPMLTTTEPRSEAHLPPDPLPHPEQEEDETAEYLPRESNDSSDSETEKPAAASSPRPADSANSPDGLFIGKLPNNKRVTIPVAALATHLSVLGAAGSGKSWLAKILAEETVGQGIPVIAVDPQGDLVQFLHPSVLPATATADERAAQQRFRERVEVRIWTPGSSHGKRMSLSPLTLPHAEDFAEIASPQRRTEEREAILTVCAGNLVRLADAGGDDEAQQTFLLEVLRQLSHESRAKVPIEMALILQAIAAPEDFGIVDPDHVIKKREREKLLQRFNTKLRGPTSNLFKDGTALNIDALNTSSKEGKTPLNVIYLNAMPDDAQKQYFVAALATEIYRWMITTPSTGKVRLLLFLDEAKDFLPAGAAKPPAKDPLLRLFAQGRKFGVGCLVCTQSPRSVDYNIFSNASTKLIGRLEAAQDVQRVQEWFRDGDGPPKWLPGRVGAAKGSWCGRWPEMDPVFAEAEFHTRQLYSLHEGAWSPDRVETEWAAVQAEADIRTENS